MVKCVYMGFGSNGFVTKAQPFPMDCHYRTGIISAMGYPKSDSVMLLVLCMVTVQYLGHRYCTIGLSGHCQPY
jgi:hypothetical protein